MGGQVRAFGGATDYMYAVAATADGNTVIAGGEDGVLRVWKLADGAAIGTYAPLPIPGSAQAAK
jgi:WD40 repeat protein